MQEYHYRLQSDYDRQVCLCGHAVRLYSLSQLRRLFPKGGYRLVGEASETLSCSDDAIGTITLGSQHLTVRFVGTANRVIQRVVGYVQVNDQEFLALLVNRFPCGSRQ